MQCLKLFGAGKMCGYDYCCFISSGIGQFRPLQGSNPTIGKVGDIEYVEEFKIEMVCDDIFIYDTIKALKESHPYEVVGYEVYKLENTFKIKKKDLKSINNQSMINSQ